MTPVAGPQNPNFMTLHDSKTFLAKKLLDAPIVGNEKAAQIGAKN